MFNLKPCRQSDPKMKKLTIKTLQQTSFKIDIDEDKSVRELKERIESDHGKDYPCDSQKLIYNGKILSDESKLAEYSIDEKKFIVLMITRPPPAPKPATTTEPTKTTASSSVKKEEAKAKTSDDSKPKASTTTTTTTSQPLTVSSATTHTATPARPSNPTAPSPAANRPNPAAGVPQMDRLAAMMHHPQFRQIQDMIQQNPHLLSQTIEALASTDPEMYTFISEHPDLFVNALNHPPIAGMRGLSSRTGSAVPGARAGGQESASEGGARAPMPAHQQPPAPALEQLVPNVSEHDKAAIERLKELGFPESMVVQAYIACDKDEQLAANLLFQMD